MRVCSITSVSVAKVNKGTIPRPRGHVTGKYEMGVGGGGSSTDQKLTKEYGIPS